MLKKLIKAIHTQEIPYSEWLTNMVMVKKAGSKWGMCVDFIDLNNVCSKDSYPLLSIDALVNSASGYAMLSTRMRQCIRLS